MKPILTVVISINLLSLSCTLFSNDWPRFLGPDGDGIVKDFDVSADWKERPPQVLWNKNLGIGNSSFAIAKDRAIVMGNTDDVDTVWCLNTSDGSLVWKYEYAEEDDNACGGAIGPSSTPTIDGSRVYTVSNRGKLFCLNLADGEVIWEKHYVEDFNGRMPICGWAASPTVEGDVLIIDPGSRDAAIVALDKLSGEFLWDAGEAKAGCSTPLIYKHRGINTLAYFHGDKLIGYDLSKEGEVLYEFSWRTFNSFNASKPKHLDGKIFISSGYGEGYAVFDVTGDEPELVHRDRELPLQFQNSLLIDGDILGIFGDNQHDSQLIRMDLKTGEIRWQFDYPGKRGNLLAVGDKIIAIQETGNMILGNATLETFETLGEIEVLPELIWAVPAFSDGRIFIRNKEGEAICLDLAPTHSS